MSCAGISLVVRRVGNLSYMSRAGISVVFRQVVSFLHDLCWNMSRPSVMGVSVMGVSSRRSAGGEFLLHASCRNFSGRSSGGESLPHAPSSNLSLFGRVGVSLTRPMLESVSFFGGWIVSLTRTVQDSVGSFGGWGICHTPSAEFCLVVCPAGGGGGVRGGEESFSNTHHAEICLVIWRMGSFFYTSCDGLCLIVR